MPERPRVDEKARDVALLLRNADRLVKEGQYSAALEAIAGAREKDPRNPYAIAYEERVKYLMKQKEGGAAASSHAPASLAKPAATPVAAPAAAAKPGVAAPAPAAPVARPAAPARPSPEDLARRQAKREEDAAAREAAARRSAIESRIQMLLKNAEAYRAKGDYTRALEEVTRALLLSPEDQEITALRDSFQRAVDDERAKKEAARLEAMRKEEEARQQVLQAEIARIQREKEEREIKEEEARRKAQQDKIRQYLERSRQQLEANRFEQALHELAFILVIDPTNSEALTLQETVHARQEQLRREEEERRRQKEEAERQRKIALESAVRKQVETAVGLADEGKFADALRAITRAYVLDPSSAEIQPVEQRIIAMREEAMKAEELQRQSMEDEERRRREEEAKRLEEQESAKIAEMERVAAEERKRANKSEIALHLDSARHELEGARYDNALAEIALAFLIDPFDQEVAGMEREILTAREMHRSEDDEIGEMGAEPEMMGEVADQVHAHVLEAQRLRTEGAFDLALDELAKAFILDPLNEEIQACEQEIEEDRRLATMEAEQTAQAFASSEVAGDLVKGHIDSAREFIASEAYDEALAEIALGLTIDPTNEDLLSFEQQIWTMQSPPEAAAPTQEQEEHDRLIQIHLLAAEEYQKQEEFVLALDEIAKAYVLDPLSAEVKRLEVKIRQNQARQNPSGSQPLKLVYPNGKVADGSR